MRIAVRTKSESDDHMLKRGKGKKNNKVQKKHRDYKGQKKRQTRTRRCKSSERRRRGKDRLSDNCRERESEIKTTALPYRERKRQKFENTR